jgi:type IV pilus assembly protein PilZ
MGIERRVMPRVDTSLEIAFRTAGVNRYSYMLNLSSGGLFIKTEQPLSIDVELEMSIQLPDDPEIMDIAGRVVWTKPESHAFPAGMGIQFIGLPPEYRQKIESFVEKNLLKHAPQQGSAQGGEISA